MATSNLTTTQLAKIIDITPRHVRRLTADGVLSRALDEDGSELEGRYSLLAVRDYCRHLRAQMKLADTGEYTHALLRNRKVAADAEMAELHLAQYKGQLHNARHIEFIWTSILTRFKARLLALPSRVARLCVGKSFRDNYDIIMREVEIVLREFSTYDVSMFKQERDAYLEGEGVDATGSNGANEEQGEDD